MHIVITGSSGLVGTSLKQIINQLTGSPNKYTFLTSKDCDLTNYNETSTFFNNLTPKPNTVIHLAAFVGGLFKNMNQNNLMFEKNLLMNYNVVKCSYEAGVTKFIGCLSTCIFPDAIKYPINEKNIHNGEPHNSNFGYAYAKRALETHCKIYRESFGLNYFCIVPTNIYGENDNYNLQDSHVIPALIHKCYLAKQENKPFIVLGSGKPLRQFIYSKDLAKLILHLTLSDRTKNIENIILAPDEKDEVSISYVAETVADIFNYKHMLTYDKTKADGQFKKTADNTLLKEFLNDKQTTFTFTSLKDGLKSTIEWFTNNYETVRK